jgi:superfamily II DNA or RNA helicase
MSAERMWASAFLSMIPLSRANKSSRSQRSITVLQNIGLSIEVDELNNFYLNKKKLDLSAIIPSDISLEYYQKETVSYLREFYNNKKAGLLVMPTGSGKTRTAVYFLLRYAISQGYQVIWLAHRSLLLEQTANTFYRNASLLKTSGSREKEADFIICFK